MAKKKPLHPFAETALDVLERAGQRALVRFAHGGIPGMVDGILEDFEGVAEEALTRTKRARSRIEARRKMRK